jgi:hypothetical protein
VKTPREIPAVRVRVGRATVTSVMRALPRRRVGRAGETDETTAVPVRAVPRETIEIDGQLRGLAVPVRRASVIHVVPVHADPARR